MEVSTPIRRFDLNAALAMYTSTMAREGYLLNQHASLASIGITDSDLSTSDMHDLEWGATVEQVGVMRDLANNLGITTEGNDTYEFLKAALEYSAATGDAGIFDWSGGRDWKTKRFGTIVQAEEGDTAGLGVYMLEQIEDGVYGDMSLAEVVELYKEYNPDKNIDNYSVGDTFNVPPGENKFKNFLGSMFRKRDSDETDEVAVEDGEPTMVSDPDVWQAGIDYALDTGQSFCNLYVNRELAEQGIEMPLNYQANALFDYMKNSKDWKDLGMDHDKALKKAEKGNIVIGVYQNDEGQGHLVAVVPYGPNGEEMYTSGKNNWDDEVPYVIGWDDKDRIENSVCQQMENEVVWEPLSYQFGGRNYDSEAGNMTYYMYKESLFGNEDKGWLENILGDDYDEK